MTQGSGVLLEEGREWVQDPEKSEGVVWRAARALALGRRALTKLASSAKSTSEHVFSALGEKRSPLPQS